MILTGRAPCHESSDHRNPRSHQQAAQTAANKTQTAKRRRKKRAVFTLLSCRIVWYRLDGRRKQRKQSTDLASKHIMQFFGILKHNSVFVTDESSESLQEQGFGAKLLRPIVQRDPSCVIRRVSKKKMLEMQQQMLDDETGGLVAASLAEEEDGEGGAVADSTAASTAAVTTTAQSAVRHVNISRPAQGDQSAPLLLFDEEAFYLFVNQHLVLQLPNGKPVTTNILWQKFSEKNNQFALKYKVYAFFRDQGFVVKTGVHYGLDYAVYRTLPTLCHSEMCAMVIDATQPLDLSHLRFSGGSAAASSSGSASGISSNDANRNHHEMMDIEAVTVDENEDIVEEDEFTRSTCQQGWRHLSTLTRVMPDVMKLLTLCYVLPATFVTRSADAAPAVLSMKVSNDTIRHTHSTLALPHTHTLYITTPTHSPLNIITPTHSPS